MNVFLDTSVLVAASVQSHPHYGRALPVLQRVAAKQDKGFISAHSLAETYAVLTRLPLKPSIHPTEAVRILTDNVIKNFDIIPLAVEDYAEILTAAENHGWVGGKIYDLLLLRGAAKREVERIYTFNLREFRKIAPPGLQAAICMP